MSFYIEQAGQRPSLMQIKVDDDETGKRFQLNARLRTLELWYQRLYLFSDEFIRRSSLSVLQIHCEATADRTECPNSVKPCHHS